MVCYKPDAFSSVIWLLHHNVVSASEFCFPENESVLSVCAPAFFPFKHGEVLTALTMMYLKQISC